MRIISEWTYKDLRISVLFMNERYVLKLEDTLLEQTYKFRDGQIRDVGHLKEILTDKFHEDCILRFQKMRASQNALFEETEDSFEFDVII